MSAVPATTPAADSADMAPVRVLQVGAGAMGRAWLATVSRSARAQLVGVVDMNLQVAEESVRAVLGDEDAANVVIGTDLEQVARECGAEAVIDVTIPAAHHPVTATALQAGLPVLGEKPCAATLPEAISLAGHTEATGKAFVVSQSRRHNPHLAEVGRLARELGGAGIVRTVFSRSPRFGGFRDEMAHPLLVDMAIHAFDAARTLIDGTPITVKATSYNPAWSWYAGDAAADVTITYDTGAVHSFIGSWCSPGRQTSWNGEWSVSCPEGSVDWDGDTPPVAQAALADPVVSPAPPEDALWELDASLDEFCRVVRHGERSDSEVHANIWTQAIVEAAVLSADQNRTVDLAELLESALVEARELDRREGRSSALEQWDTAKSRLRTV